MTFEHIAITAIAWQKGCTGQEEPFPVSVQMLEYYTTDGDWNHSSQKEKTMKVLLASESRAALKTWLN